MSSLLSAHLYLDKVYKQEDYDSDWAQFDLNVIAAVYLHFIFS